MDTEADREAAGSIIRGQFVRQRMVPTKPEPFDRTSTPRRKARTRNYRGTAVRLTPANARG